MASSDRVRLRTQGDNACWSSMPTLSLLLSATIAALLLAHKAGASASASTDITDGTAFDRFDRWLTAHGKSYPDNDRDEYTRRLAVYAANAALVVRHNDAHELGLTGYAMSMDGPFADLTDVEFESLHLMEGQNCSATHKSSGPVSGASMTASSGKPLPTSFDWRTKGVITPVKSQGHCGSCWTFSTTGTLEAHHCISLNLDCSDWTGLAEQQLVDCAGNYNNHGCKGGLPSQAFEYIRYGGGICTEDSYKYTAEDGACKKHKRKDIGARVRGVHNITTFDEDGIVKAVANVGPVSVAFQVSSDFRFYSHGVYDSFNATTNRTMCKKDAQHVNHAVVAVGFGETMEDPPVPFHIIRNSWGNAWGMEGYFWMLRNENMCGVSDCASYPLVRSRPAEQPEKQQQQKKKEKGGQQHSRVASKDGSDTDKATASSSDLFNDWITTNGKSYDSIDEYSRRLTIFAANARLVSLHNDAHERGLTSYTMSTQGPFADLTFEEFASLYLMKRRNCYDSHISSGPVPLPAGSLSKPLPASVDWRTKGVLTPIKSQGHCGSCWSFSATGTLESHHCISQGLDCSHWAGLAEQQLVDCSGSFNNNGCAGGWPSQAFEYIHYSGGIVTEESYKYAAKDGTCKKLKKKEIGARVRAVHNITSFDEGDIIKAVAHLGPVSIAFDVASGFQLYSHGVYDSFNAATNQTMCKTDIRHVNHAVVVVGYGETMQDPPVPFHVIRNSWGNLWGMEGYFWVLRGKNMCGLSDCAAYPLVYSRPSLRQEPAITKLA